MSRDISGAKLKTGKYGAQNDVPRPGTHIRALWDRLFADAGYWIPLHELSAAYGRNLAINRGPLNHLRDSYGLDIRCGWGKWLLAGEHIGVAYIDYVAEKKD